ncbi:MAG: TIGR02281 family clan AA aspartic protease [Elusimicrobiota bacterium]
MSRMIVLNLLFAMAAHADTVFLKNGNTMEGLVTRETKEEVELDIGYGSVVLKKSDIRRVKRSSKKQREALESRQKELRMEPPKGAEELHAALESLMSKREAALAARDKKAELEAEQPEFEARIASLDEGFGPASDRLKDARGEGRDAYTEAVQDLNELSADVRAAFAKLQSNRRDIDAAGKEMGGYLQAYADFKARLAQDARSASDKGPFYAMVRRTVKKLDKDFRTERVAARRIGPHVVVTALLNGKVKADLIVDTGASVVVISESVAKRLALAPGDVFGKAEAVMADGRKIEAEAVRLKSMEVGGRRAAGVDAAILPQAEPGIDGLLGMSFLKRYAFRIDPEGGRLLLTELR